MIAGIPLAVATAVYTAFLFAQAKARDLWQSSLLPPHMLVQAVLLGAAVLLPFGQAAHELRWVLGGAALAHVLLALGEVSLAHPTAHAHLAVRELTRGSYARWFWGGLALAAVAVAAPWIGVVAVAPALLGVLCHEHAYVQSGQAVPLRMSRRLDGGEQGAEVSASPTPGAGSSVQDLNERVTAAKRETLARGETFYPGPSRVHLAAFPPRERWDDWTAVEPDGRERRYALVPTTCFNCESACGLLAYVDRETLQVRKFEGNPEHPGSRGRNCAKGPATLNQVTDPDRILYPLRRAGERGEGRWERVSWDEALDDIATRIRRALVEGRPNSVMYHVGRPGEDGFTERVLAAWGVDGHNSHTNICSSGGRAGYHWWMGLDRPSPDHANADAILLVSSHLEAGHYFNPHAQRILEAKQRGAKLVVLDTRLSNTATHADHWLAPQPGSEAAILLAIADHLIRTGRYDREFVRRWWNWQEYLACEHARRAADVRGVRADPRRALRRAHLRGSPSASRASLPRCCARWRRSWPRREPGSPRTSGARRRPATSAAGRWGGRSSC